MLDDATASVSDNTVDANQSTANDATASENTETDASNDFENVFEDTPPKEDTQIKGLHGYLNTLDDETRQKKFHEQPDDIKFELSEKYPEKYKYDKASYRESLKKDIIADLSKQELVKKAQADINEFVENEAEFIKSHGQKFRNALIEAKGLSPEKRLNYAIGVMVKKGLYVPSKVISEAEKRGAEKSGQILNSSTGGESPANSKSSIQKAFEKELKRVGKT